MSEQVTIIQITDTHLTGDQAPLHGSVDTAAQLRHVVERIMAGRRTIDAIVLSGDTSSDGSAASYSRLISVLEPLATTSGAQVIHLPGNHDDRDEYAEALGLPHGFDRAVDIGALRIVSLDSTRPGRHDGYLTAEQLNWLATQIATAPKLGLVLCLHHPPMRSPIRTVDALRLKNADELADVLDASVVRAILGGHVHYTGCAVVAGIPVWSGVPASYQLDGWAPAGQQRGLGGYGFSRIDIDADGISAIAVPAEAAPVVYERDDASYDELLAEYLGT
ncbi:metallophosphatase [Epidermidibacterium keratini]|uniref:Metallophosphatase n=1 Tax=Epidermidibacterium keratini TaxID=1891644 RepID=A0A7M3T521_9ACTN|nr:metallophosphoesterase [Epidermidibacterium keratini]QHB98878.1 metallophosphatase [Epidermidibacterium keratini]